MDICENTERYVSTSLLESALELLDSGSCDRRDIADALGIGMTLAGRIVSHLTSSKFVREQRIGRRTRLIYSMRPTFTAVSVTPNEIISSTVDAKLNIRETFHTSITHAPFFDDALISALRRISLTDTRGIVFVANGTLDHGGTSFNGTPISGLDGLDLHFAVREFLPSAKVLLFPRQRCTYGLAEADGTVVCLNESDGYLRASVFTPDGHDIGGAGLIGDIYTPRGTKVEGCIRYAKDHNTYVYGIAAAVYALSKMIMPAKILLDIERYSTGEEIVRALTEVLMRDFGMSGREIPPISCFTDEDDRLLPARRAMRLHIIASETAKK